MSRSYPVWVDVHSCAYNSPNKSYGIKETGEQTIKCGSSAKNSHVLASVVVTKREVDGKIIFRYSYDGVILKEAVFHNNKGKAGELIEIKSHLRKATK